MGGLDPLSAALLLGGSTGLQMAGDRHAANERRDILNRQLARTDATQGKVTQQVLDEGKKFTPESRMADMATNENRVYDQSQKDLGAASPIAQAVSGATSGDYQRSKALSDAMEGTRLSALAREVAKTRSPGELMTAEGLRRADLTGDIAHQWGVDKNMSDAAQIDAENVEVPWYGQVGKIANQIGMAMALGGIGAPPVLKPKTTGSFSRVDRGQLWGD